MPAVVWHRDTPLLHPTTWPEVIGCPCNALVVSSGCSLGAPLHTSPLSFMDPYEDDMEMSTVSPEFPIDDILPVKSNGNNPNYCQFMVQCVKCQCE